jgi:hypothetical protein
MYRPGRSYQSARLWGGDGVLTCASNANGGGDAKQGKVGSAALQYFVAYGEHVQQAGLVALYFVLGTTLGAFESVGCSGGAALRCLDPFKKTVLVGDEGAGAGVGPCSWLGCG